MKGRKVIRLDLNATQATLFGVGRLRAMVGANALLGEFLASVAPSETKGVPLAIDDATRAMFAGIGREQGGIDADDPLGRFEEGVVTAAAGKLVVVVSEDDADGIVRRIRLQAAMIVPHGDFGVEVGDFSAEAPEERASNEASWVHQCFRKVESEATDGEAVTPPVALPYLRRCPHSASESALARVTADELFDSEALFSRSTVRRGMANAGYSTFQIMRQGVRRRTSKDFLGTFVSQMRSDLEEELKREVRWPADVEDLCGPDEGSGYALVLMDGNSMGAEYGRFVDRLHRSSSLDDEVAREEWFWWRIRCSLRHAIRDGLFEVARRHAGREKGVVGLPYEILWLGGDDLGLMVRPEYAFDLVARIARSYETSTERWLGQAIAGVVDARSDDHPSKSTLGASVLVAPRSLPFALAHSLAEEVLDSAKSLRQVEGYGTDSVVDWHVVRASGSAGLDETRAKEWMLAEDDTYLLTKRPVPVLRSEPPRSRPSLEVLLDKARELAESEDGRNRSERMRTYARMNSYVARWMYRELFGETLFEPVGLHAKDDLQPKLHWTEFLDTAELSELVRPGSMSGIQ